ncbi:MAG: universal stress protein [Acidimicrobiales bacterium]
MTQNVKAERIVVGYDGSPDSERALEWAAQQAEFTGSHLQLIGVWEWPTGLGWVAIPPSDFDPSKEVTKTLDEAVAKIKVARPNVSVTSRVIEGSAFNSLVDESRGAALLVVGTRGHGEVAGLLIGSVSQYCAAHAHCPVVVIRAAK